MRKTAKILLLMAFSFAIYPYKRPFVYDEVFYAAATGNADFIKEAIDWGFYVNERDINKNTLLIWAVRRGHINVVRLLLENRNLNLNAINKVGATALMYASFYGQEEVARLLLQNKDLCVNLKNKFGLTSLILAIINGQTKIAQMLLSRNDIDVNIQDRSGNSALMYASKVGYRRLIESLIQKKDIDLDLKNKRGQTAIMLAAQNKHDDIVESLAVDGANISGINDPEMFQIAISAVNLTHELEMLIKEFY